MLAIIEEQLGKPIYRTEISKGFYRDTIEASKENEETDWQSLAGPGRCISKKPKEKKQEIKVMIKLCNIAIPCLCPEHPFRVLEGKCQKVFHPVVPGHSHTGSLYCCPEVAIRYWICLVHLPFPGGCFFPGTTIWFPFNEKDSYELSTGIFLHGDGSDSLCQISDRTAINP